MSKCCKDCTKRWVDTVNLKTCHTECAEYLEFQQEKERINQLRHKEHTTRESTIGKTRTAINSYKQRG